MKRAVSLAEKMEKRSNKDGWKGGCEEVSAISSIYLSMGVVEHQLGRIPEALESSERGLRTLEAWRSSASERGLRTLEAWRSSPREEGREEGREVGRKEGREEGSGRELVPTWGLRVHGEEPLQTIHGPGSSKANEEVSTDRSRMEDKVGVEEIELCGSIQVYGHYNAYAALLELDSPEGALEAIAAAARSLMTASNSISKGDPDLINLQIYKFTNLQTYKLTNLQP